LLTYAKPERILDLEEREGKMADTKQRPAEQQAANKKINRTPQAFMPRTGLKDVVLLTSALRDDFAGADATPIDLAQSVGRSPSSSTWQFLTGAAVAYGLTTGAYNANTISLTTRGQKLTMPTEEGEDKGALLEAALTPEVPKAFYEKYDRNKFPSETIAKNVLAQLGVPRERVEEALKIIVDNAKLVGILKEVSGNLYVQLRSSGTANAGSISNPAAEEEPVEEVFNDTEVDDNTSAAQKQDEPPIPVSQKPKPIFIAHGKDKKPLEQLKVILDQFKIPYRVDVDEPHAGRPISEKVRSLMNECGSAIVIFTSSGESTDPEKGTVANLNVVFELGAASVLYGDKIILFKERDLTLPSDFSDLGHIAFDKESLDAKAFDLIKELISMGWQFTPAG
jgi:predicted nucleotide-binding protein